MNFLKSVFSDDPHPPYPDSEPHPNQTEKSAGGVWNFGGLIIKTLSSKSESVIETYTRDLKEFGSVLRKEIQVAHGSLDDIISRGKDAILTIENPNSDNNNNNHDNDCDRSRNKLISRRYSQFDELVRVDPKAYIVEPEDKEEYRRWKIGFGIEEKREEMGRLLEEDEEMKGAYRRMVPGIANEEEFWGRYYYEVDKIRRGEIAKRAISREEEEEKEKSGVEGNVDLGVEVEVEAPESVVNRVGDGEMGGCGEYEGNVDVKEVKESTGGGGNVPSEEAGNLESDEKVGVSEAAKDGEVSDVLRCPPEQEEDLEWDEIEDLSGIDEKRVGHRAIPNKIDLRKRLSAAEEEDLSWDI